VVIQKINLPLNLEKVFHISDVHCRLYKRHREYRDVFDNLYIELNKQKENYPNSIIYLSGDLVHLKTEMSPELVNIVDEFLDKLSNIFPLLIIPGNHDGNINNFNRMDSLEPIINRLKSTKIDNIIYMKESGIYYNKNNNVLFSIKSIYDEDELLSVEEINNLDNNKFKDYKKIVSYHGVVNGATNESNYTFKNSSINKPILLEYDMGMLGDIHKFQYLSDNVAYAGSLIQQNFAETLHSHGMLVWDIKTNKSELVEIKNDYGFVQIYIDNNGNIIDEDKLIIPNKPRIKLNSNPMTKQSDINKVESELKKKYNVQSFYNGGTSKLNDNNSMNIDEDIYNNISNVEYQNNLIEEFLKNKYDKISESELLEIKEINKLLNNEITFDKNIMFGRQWNLKSLEFENMFGYGKGKHKIDFDEYEGIVGIFGKNHSGKSSIVDIITFALSKKCSRSSKGIDFLNNKNNKNKLYTKICFTLNNEDYYIERSGAKDGKDRMTFGLNFYNLDANGNKVDLDGDSNQETEKIIQDYIGTYESFIDTFVSTQNNNSGIINKKQSDRKKFFNSLLGIDIFEVLHKKGNQELLEYKTLLKEYRNKKLDVLLSNEEKELIEIKKDLTAKQKIYYELTIDNDEYKQEKQNQISSKKDTKNIKSELELNNKILEIQNNIDICNESNTLKNNKISELQNNINEILYSDDDKIIFRNEIKELNDINSDLNNNKKSLYNIDNTEESLLYEIKELEEKINKTESSNSFLELGISTIKKDIINIDKVLESKEDITYLKNNCEKVEKDIRSLNTELKIKYMEIDNTKDKSEKLLKLEYDHDCSYCMNNIFVKDAIKSKENLQKLIDEKIEIENNIKTSIESISDKEKIYEMYNIIVNKEKEKQELEQKIISKSNEITMCKNNIENWKNKIEQFNSDIEKIKLDEESKIHNLNINNKIEIINNKISDINNKIDLIDLKSKLLSDITSIKLEISNNDLLKNNLERDKEVYTNLKDSIIFNSKVDKLIENIDIIITNLTTKIKNADEDIKKLLVLVGVSKNQIEIYKEELDKFKKLEIQFNLYSKYCESVNKDGIPLVLIQRSLPLLEKKTNDVLSTIADFTLHFDSNNKDIDIKITRGLDNQIPVESGSGFEKFVANIATRIASLYISNLNKSDFIIIDEGFGNFDNVNLGAINQTFEYLMNDFKFILVISHIDLLKENANHIIDVNVDSDGYSYI